MMTSSGTPETSSNSSEINISELPDTTASWQPKPLNGLWFFLKYSFSAYVIFTLLFSGTFVAVYLVTGESLMSDDGSGSHEWLIEGSFFLFHATVGVLSFLNFLVCVVAYARFYHRAMKNLYAFDIEGMSVKPAWTWGWFFIPFANFLMPFRGAKQVFEYSHNPNGISRPPTMSRLRWWWGLWLGGTILSNLSGSMDPSTSMNAIVGAHAFAAAFLIGSALLVISFSKDVFEAQNRNLFQR